MGLDGTLKGALYKYAQSLFLNRMSSFYTPPQLLSEKVRDFLHRPPTWTTLEKPVL